MTPGFLITTSNYLLAFDGEAHFSRVHSGKGLYYGLAHGDRGIYVACRNETEELDDPSSRAKEMGSILVLDPASLLPVEEIRPEFAMRDVHGIACFDRKLWVTCSFDNLVAIFDEKADRWTKWYPAIDPGACGRDVNHFNTIVPYGDRICLLAHNNGPSQVLFYDRSSLELCSVLELGCQAHDIVLLGEAVVTCSSAEGLLIDNVGWRLRTGAFPRGILRSDEGIWLGLSQVAHRSVRHETSGILRRFTPRWQHLADYVLPHAGMVLAILPIGSEQWKTTAREPFAAEVFCGEYNPLEAGNVYRAGLRGFPASAGEWHAAEDSHRWTAARQARMTIVVNPGETTLLVSASSGLPGPYWVDVMANGRSLGRIDWSQAGFASSKFLLPPVYGSCDVCFRVPHLWRPSHYLGTDDTRQLGVSIQELTIL